MPPRMSGIVTPHISMGKSRGSRAVLISVIASADVSMPTQFRFQFVGCLDGRTATYERVEHEVHLRYLTL